MKADIYDVLIADDEPKIRRGFRQWIEEGLHPLRVCAEAEDARQALELALEEKPQLMLVDINMPYGGGLELIRRVNAALPGTMVIVISGYDNFEYVREAFKREAFDYLLKPVPRSDFDRIMEQAVKILDENRGRGPREKTDVPEKSGLVRSVEEYIEEHYGDRELNLQRCAEKFKVNKAYLSRLMKQELNAGFVDYLTTFRVEKAKELLSHSGDDLKMYRIAEKVGFSSQHYFSRVFKQSTGLSPLEYRQRG